MKNRFLLDAGREEWSKLQGEMFSVCEKDDRLYL